MKGFGTIKKLPARRTPRREAVQRYRSNRSKKTPVWLSPYKGVGGYENQREISKTISLSESETAKVTLNRKKFFCIRQPPLSIRPSGSYQKLTLGLAISGRQNRKKTPPVYMGVV